MDQKEDLRKVDDREFVLGFLLHKLTQGLFLEGDAVNELEKNKMIDFSASVKGPGIKLKGTIIIKEES